MFARILPFLVLIVTIFLVGKLGYELIGQMRKRRTKGDWAIGIFIAIALLIMFLSRIAET